MNINTLKQEAREKWSADFDYRFRGNPPLLAVDPRKATNFLDTLIDRVVDAVEAAVVPEHRPLNFQGNPGQMTHDDGHNDCREDVLEAFKRFRNPDSV